MPKRSRKPFIQITAALILSLGLLVVLFYGLLTQYQKNSAYGGAAHLIEINRQGKTNIASMLDRDRKVAADVSNEIKSGALADREALLRFMDAQKENWAEDDIEVYTAGGKCISCSGSGQTNGSAAEFAARVVEKGEVFQLVGSKARYAAKLDADYKIDGSKVVAVAVVRSLDQLFSEGGIVSFGGVGSLYLVRENGVRVSASGGENVQNVYNLLSVFEKGTLENLTDSGLSLEETMKTGKEGAYLFSESGSGPQYVVLTPLSFMDSTLYLFNLVPQAAVSKTTTEFTNSVIVLLAVVMLLVVFFFVFYLQRAGRYNRALFARERLFDTLVEETNYSFMLLKTGKGKPDYISANAGTYLGSEIAGMEAEGKGYRLVGNAGTPDCKALEELNKALGAWDGKKAFISDYLTCGSGADKQYLRFSLYPVSSGQDEYIGITQDVTKDYEREKNLREALNLANSANMAKSQFLSNVSHDIRTPLNAIINMVRFLQDEISDKNEAGQLDIIRQSSEHLLELINDVLDISRIESGKLTFTEEVFDVGAVIDEAGRIIRPLCEKKNQTFLIQKEIRHPAIVGDSLRLSQILLNVLNNAVKYTGRDGRIEFTAAELSSIKAGTVPLRFTVKDNGIGIEESRLQEIFRPFTRLENSTVRKTEGTGLGLAITRNIVDAMGGTISVQSKVGEGSVFTVEIPFAVGEKMPSEPEPDTDVQAIRFDGRRALLAEDNEINAAIAEKILEDRGMKVETAGDGAMTVKMVTGHEAGYYDVIYMDIQMPVMDGYSAARKIRQMQRTDAAEIPIIAMTANAFAEDVEKARASGMNAHIAKPIDPNELYRISKKVLTENRAGKNEGG